MNNFGIFVHIFMKTITIIIVKTLQPTILNEHLLQRLLILI